MSTPDSSDTLLATLAEPHRRALLQALRLGPRTVTELVLESGLKQPNVSNHLARLRDYGLVRASRRGRMVYYSLADPATELLLQAGELAGAHHGGAWGADATPEHRIALEPDRIPPADMRVCSEACGHALASGDEATAVQIVNNLLTRRVPMERIYGEVLQPAMYYVGDLYGLGQIDEAVEHVATNTVERLMAKVSAFSTLAISPTPQLAIGGCVAGNEHSLGLRMLMDVLAVRGWRCLFMGGNVPTAGFVEMVRRQKPALVLASCSLPWHTGELQDLTMHLDKLRKTGEAPHFQISVGGLCLRTRLDYFNDVVYDFTARDIPEFVTAVGALPLHAAATELIAPR